MHKSTKKPKNTRDANNKNNNINKEKNIHTHNFKQIRPHFREFMRYSLFFFFIFEKKKKYFAHYTWNFLYALCTAYLDLMFSAAVKCSKFCSFEYCLSFVVICVVRSCVGFCLKYPSRFNIRLNSSFGGFVKCNETNL